MRMLDEENRGTRIICVSNIDIIIREGRGNNGDHEYGRTQEDWGRNPPLVYCVKAFFVIHKHQLVNYKVVLRAGNLAIYFHANSPYYIKLYL